jgi:ATP-dependent HslUV protease ATP-binding subunit HslU
MTNLTPQQIVAELDKYIVGQREVKRAVAIALRHRERRQLTADMGTEIHPKNILMIGPTGVGKTEIARRVAALIDAPFLKAEATRFTEVGYVGKDAESIVHDLVEDSMTKVYSQKLKEVESKAEKLATERLLNYICQQLKKSKPQKQATKQLAVAQGATSIKVKGTSSPTRRFVARLLQDHKLDDQLVEIEIPEVREEFPTDLELAPSDLEDFRGAFADTVARVEGKGKSRHWRKIPVKEARRLLAREEASKLLDYSEVVDEATKRVEERGVVFIDEMDKITGARIEIGRDVSGEGVQRDLLPIVEGTTVMTRYGPVKTDHILFMAAGAFHRSKPSDLIPELQGRFPLRVELTPLSQEDLERILTEPQYSLTKQYQALLATEGVELVFAEDGVQEMARLATLMNEQNENIGARRLNTIMERVLEELNYSAAERKGEKVVVDTAYVSQHIGDLVKNRDLSRYIL